MHGGRVERAMDAQEGAMSGMRLADAGAGVAPEPSIVASLPFVPVVSIASLLTLLARELVTQTVMGKSLVSRV